MFTYGVEITSDAKYIKNQITTNYNILPEKLKNKSVETGRIQKSDNKSNIDFIINNDIQFNSIPSYTYELFIRPQSTMTIDNIVSYCSNCGRRRRNKQNYCPKCGNKF